MDCGECTLCCKLLEIRSLPKKAGTWCEYCEIDRGCKIHDTDIPEECSKFSCAYRQMKKVSLNLRPDKCGVIFERFDDIFIGTVDPNINGFSDDLKGQIYSFLREGFSIVLFNQRIQKPVIYTSKNHTAKEVWEKIKEIRKKRENKWQPQVTQQI